MFFETALDAFTAQAITLLHAQWQKQFRRAVIGAQDFIKQRQRSHAIDIVITKEHDAFALIQCSENARNSSAHLRQQKRIAQRAETRAQEVFNFLRAAKAFSRKQPRNAFRPADFTPRNCAAIQLLARRQNPTALPRKAWRGLFISWLTFYAALHRSVYSPAS